MSTIKEPSKRAMRRRLAGVATLVVLAILSSSHVEAFAPRPAVTPQIRSVPKMTPRDDPFSMATWERPNDVETELVDKDAFDVRLDSLKQMQIGQENPIAKKTMNPTHAAFAAVIAALALTLFLTPLPSMAAMSGDRIGESFSSPLGDGDPGVVTPSRADGVRSLITAGIYVYIIIETLGSLKRDAEKEGSSSSDLGKSTSSALGPGTSIVQVTVGLEVPNRDDPNSILSALGRLTNTASTDSTVGIQNLTSQVAFELLRRKNSIVSASTKYKHFKDRSTALREFNSRSIYERLKFEKEIVSNYGGVDYGSCRGGESDNKVTMAVVTILLSIDGDKTKVPKIRSVRDVEDALLIIASDSKMDTCLQGAEILWTPEERSETLSARDVFADYPELRSV